MNLPYLVSILKTDKLSEVVANIDLLPLDLNLAIWDAIDRKEVEVDEENDRIKVLVEVTPSSDPELKTKLLRVIQHYSRQELNITRGRLNAYIKDALTNTGYPWHEYIMALQHLIDGELVVEEVVDVPAAVKKFVDGKGRKKQKEIRPAHKFVFLGLAENADKNAEWNAAEVQKWIANFETDTVQ